MQSNAMSPMSPTPATAHHGSSFLPDATDTVILLTALRSPLTDGPHCCLHLMMGQDGLTFCHALTERRCWGCDRPVCPAHGTLGRAERGEDQPSLLCQVCALLPHAHLVIVQQARVKINS